MLTPDSLYGSREIKEPVLQALMQSQAMKRLRGVSQHGITALLGITAPFSRYDHCVGTMLLVRDLGARLDEQIAALLHDISHTAFSHVVDYVFDDHAEQGYHERHKLAYVAASDIPGILDQHGHDWRDYMDETGFPLLEQPSPLLCADRLDYFLRDLEFMQLARADDIQQALAALQVVEGQVVVTDVGVAGWLAYTYIEVDRASWSNPREVGLYQLTAEAIKAAFAAGLLDESDLWRTDAELWQKLKTSDHPEVHRLVKLVTPATRFVEDQAAPMMQVSSKVRSIDPPVLRGGTLKRLSELDSNFDQYRQAYHAHKQGGCSLRYFGP